MDSAHNLILNEEAFKKIEEHKKPVYVFEWLRSLDKLLVAAQKVSGFCFGKFSIQTVERNRADFIYFLVYHNRRM